MSSLLTGVAQEVQPMHGHNSRGEGSPGGRGQQERFHPSRGDRPGTESGREQAGSGRTQARETTQEEEGETGERTAPEGRNCPTKVGTSVATVEGIVGVMGTRFLHKFICK